MGQHRNPSLLLAKDLYGALYNAEYLVHKDDPDRPFPNLSFAQLDALRLAANESYFALRDLYANLAKGAYAEFNSSTYQQILWWEANVTNFKSLMLNLSSFTTCRPEVFTPFELIPVHQKGYSYYAAVPANLPAPALHTEARDGDTQALMRYVDFAIMREMWTLKDVQSWGEMAATVVSTALSTLAMKGIQKLGGKAMQALNGARGRSALGGIGGKQKPFWREVLNEIIEETVYEPIVGEWLLTLLSAMREGATQQLDSDLARGQMCVDFARAMSGGDLGQVKGLRVARISADGELMGIKATMLNAQEQELARQAWTEMGFGTLSPWGRVKQGLKSLAFSGWLGRFVFGQNAPRGRDISLATQSKTDLNGQIVNEITTAVNGVPVAASLNTGDSAGSAAIKLAHAAAVQGDTQAYTSPAATEQAQGDALAAQQAMGDVLRIIYGVDVNVQLRKGPVKLQPRVNFAVDAALTAENVIFALEVAAAHELFNSPDNEFASEAEVLAEIQRTGAVRKQVSTQGNFFFQVARRKTSDPAKDVPFIQVDQFPGLLQGGDVVLTAVDVGRFVATHAFANLDQKVAKDLEALPPVVQKYIARLLNGYQWEAELRLAADPRQRPQDNPDLTWRQLIESGIIFRMFDPARPTAQEKEQAIREVRNEVNYLFNRYLYETPFDRLQAIERYLQPIGMDEEARAQWNQKTWAYLAWKSNGRPYRAFRGLDFEGPLLAASSTDQILQDAGLLKNPRNNLRQVNKIGEQILALSENMPDSVLRQRLQEVGTKLKTLRNYKDFSFMTFRVAQDALQDAENKIFENLRLDILLRLAQGRLQGDEELNFLVYTTLQPCPSCLMSAAQLLDWFEENFPGLKISITIKFQTEYTGWIRNNKDPKLKAIKEHFGLPSDTDVFDIFPECDEVRVLLIFFNGQSSATYHRTTRCGRSCGGWTSTSCGRRELRILLEGSNSIMPISGFPV